MPLPNPARDTPQFHAMRISAGVQDQVLGGLIQMPGAVWRVVLLQTGAAEISDATSGAWHDAPILIWTPWTDAMRLRVRAGSTGVLLTLSEQMLANTLGHKPEAADLRMMLQHPVQADLGPARPVRDDVEQCFRVILREAASDDPGAATLIEAQCRVIAVLLWRLFLQTGLEIENVSRDRRNLQVFRALLETHFRQRWPVAAYADAMGMSPDRLLDLCQRALGRPPSALIRDRLVHEAQLLLTRSALPLGEIAGQLGFFDGAQFSKFFAREFGMPPGQFRRSLERDQGSHAAAGSASFADWP